MAPVRAPRFRIPPPAIFALVFLVALWIEAALYRIWFVQDVRAPMWLIVTGAMFIIAGVALAVTGVMAFRRARTTIMPYREASSFVMSGPYRYTRNPMYLGMALVQIGGALALNAGWPLLLLPVSLGLLYLLVIRGEEAQMRQTFGGEYDAYVKRVRRWL